MQIGFDEVGRGCVAGPVVVGLTILSETKPILTQVFHKLPLYYSNFRFARDSKKLSSIRRNQVTELVNQANVCYKILSASNKLIDDFGIGACLSHLLYIGVYLLTGDKPANTLILIDGKIKLLNQFNLGLVNKILQENNIDTSYKNLANELGSYFQANRDKFIFHRENKADEKYLAVALSSNLAKVYRDNLMQKLSQDYPEYGWDKNVGYATAAHCKAIKQNPDNIYLRKTWLTKILKK